MNELEEQLTRSNIFNLKIIQRGVTLFVIISVIAIIGVFVYSNRGMSWTVWRQFNPLFFIYAIVFIISDQFIGAFRNHIFVREFSPSINLWVSVKANLSNIFMSAVTPSQMGGGPAQWYIYNRHGLSVADGFGISFYNWISTIIFFPISGAMALYLLEDRVPKGLVTHLTRFGFSTFATLLFVVLIGLLAPNFFNYLLRGLISVIGELRSSWGEKIDTIGTSATNKLETYRNKYTGLIRRKPQLMLYSFIVTTLLYFNKYVMAYFLVLAFGLEVDLWSVVAIQAIVYLLLYFAPSPGGSGIAELSITAMMAVVIQDEYLASFTVVFRTFTVFIPLILGALVVMKQVKEEKLST